MLAGLTTSSPPLSWHARATTSSSAPRIAAMLPVPTGTASCISRPRSPHDRDGVGKTQRPGRDVGRILTQAVAGHEIRRETAARKDPQGRDAGGEDRGLRVLGQHQVRPRGLRRPAGSACGPSRRRRRTPRPPPRTRRPPRETRGRASCPCRRAARPVPGTETRSKRAFGAATRRRSIPAAPGAAGSSRSAGRCDAAPSARGTAGTRRSWPPCSASWVRRLAVRVLECRRFGFGMIAGPRSVLVISAAAVDESSSAPRAADLPTRAGSRTCSCSGSCRTAGTGPAVLPAQRLHRQRQVELLPQQLVQVDLSSR